MPEWVFQGIIFLLLAIAAGVVGNAAWEGLRTWTPKAVLFIYSVLTRASARGRDDVIRQAATGVDHLGTTFFLTMVAVVVGLADMIFLNRVIERALSIEESKPAEPGTLYFNVLLVVMFVLFAFINYLIFRVILRLALAIMIVRQFRHRMTIAGPALSIQEKLELHRDFASLGDGAAYDAFQRRFTSLLTDHGVVMPAWTDTFWGPPFLRRKPGPVRTRRTKT
jgi:hypothetical protein